MRKAFGVEEERTAWIGLDFDGTLVEYDGWVGPEHIGKPIPDMMNRLRDWLVQGQVVKIVTARATIPEQIPPIKKWLKEQGLPDLEITASKDFNMTALWDDHVVQVETNTGRVLSAVTEFSKPK